MSDETLHPDPDVADETLASQYVDDQLSAAERAQVEASPQVMALVQRFDTQRSLLADVPPPAATARDAAVAAALAQFTMVEPPPNVVSLDRRRQSRWLSAAAAVVLLGVGGIALAGLTGGDDTSVAVQNATGDAAKTDRNAPTPTEPGQMEVAGGTSEDTFVDGTGVDNTVAGSPDTGLSGGADPTIGSINGPVSPVPELRTDDDLRAVTTTGAPVVPSFELACTIDEGKEILAEITWNGTPALVVRDTVDGVITALDAQCRALASVAP